MVAMMNLHKSNLFPVELWCVMTFTFLVIPFATGGPIQKNSSMPVYQMDGSESQNKNRFRESILNGESDGDIFTTGIETQGVPTAWNDFYNYYYNKNTIVNNNNNNNNKGNNNNNNFNNSNSISTINNNNIKNNNNTNNNINNNNNNNINNINSSNTINNNNIKNNNNTNNNINNNNNNINNINSSNTINNNNIKNNNTTNNNTNTNQKAQTRVRRSLASRVDPFHEDFECDKDDYFLDEANAVVGGEEAVPHSQPWITYIRAKFPGQRAVKACGGTIISAQWILSAGHCFEHDGEQANEAWVLMGIHSPRIEPNEVSIIGAVPKKHIFTHDGFDRGRLSNDVALLKLPRPIPELHHKVRHSCLPLSGVNPDVGDECTASGWGVTGAKLVHISRVLMTIQVQINICDDYGLDKTIICTRKPPSVTKNQDTCRGDSGGPLICRQQNGKPMLMGVLSKGSRACTGSRFEVAASYTKVTAYLDWIKKTIRANMDNSQREDPTECD